VACPLVLQIITERIPFFDRFFGGLRAGRDRGGSPDTVLRDWKLARAWLLAELNRKSQARITPELCRRHCWFDVGQAFLPMAFLAADRLSARRLKFGHLA